MSDDLLNYLEQIAELNPHARLALSLAATEIRRLRDELEGARERCGKSAASKNAMRDALVLTGMARDAAIADAKALRQAAAALRDDMIMRAKMNGVRGGEVVVEAGAGVWARFNAALGRISEGEG